MSLKADRDLSCSTLRVCGTGTAHFTAVPEQQEQQGTAGTACCFALEVLFRSTGTSTSETDLFPIEEKRILFPNLGTAQKGGRAGLRHPPSLPSYPSRKDAWSVDNLFTAFLPYGNASRWLLGVRGETLRTPTHSRQSTYKMAKNEAKMIAGPIGNG